MKRALVLAAAASLLALPSTAGAEPALPLSDADVAQIRAHMATPPFNEGIWGMLATDVETGRELFSLNADRLFHSASTTKNYTTAAALDRLGPATASGRRCSAAGAT